MFNLRQSLNLVDRALLQLWTHLKLLYLNDLDCNQLIVALISSFIYLTILTLAHYLLQVVVLNLLYHYFFS
jgi:hypothetical protein